MTLDITTQGLIDQAAHAADTAGDGILALRYVARSFRLSFSEQAVRSSVAWSAENASDHIATIGEQVGLAFTSIAANPKKIDAFACPLILVRPDGQTLVIESLSQDGTAEFVSFSRTETDRNEMPLTQLLEPGARLWKVRPRRSLPDARIDAYIAPARKNWLRKILFPSLAPYLTVILASVMVNMLGLSGILFSTQVYDRVIPAQSMNTLAVLFGGVAIGQAGARRRSIAVQSGVWTRVADQVRPQARIDRKLHFADARHRQNARGADVHLGRRGDGFAVLLVVLLYLLDDRRTAYRDPPCRAFGDPCARSCVAAKAEKRRPTGPAGKRAAQCRAGRGDPGH
mgnify:CR=1 FL=1